jgi:hypothetical protein
MIVAVIAVRMMQVACDEVVRVVAVRDRVVAAVGAVLVAFLMAAAIVAGRAASRIRGVDRQHVFLDGAAIGMVQMSVVKIIDVAVVEDARVPATRTMLVSVVFMLSRHVIISFRRRIPLGRSVDGREQRR